MAMYFITSDGVTAESNHPKHAQIILQGLKAIGYGSPDGPAIQVDATAEDAGDYEDDIAHKLQRYANGVDKTCQLDDTKKRQV